MKKTPLLIIPLLVTSIYLLSPSISLVFAQDAPNTNVTKRRPDRPATYSPTPVSSGIGSPSQPEVKQVQTSKSSFWSDLWARIKTFFAKLFKLPEASSTSSTS